MKNLRLISFLLILFLTVLSDKGFPQSSSFVSFFDYDTPYVFSLEVTADNNFLLLGSVITQNGGKTILVKADKSGKLQWTKLLGRDNENTGGVKIVSDQEDNYTICGTTSVYPNPPHGNSPGRLFLTKLNSKGDSLFWKDYNKTKWNQKTEDMEESDNGGYLASGYFDSDSTRGFLYKLDSKGDSIWGKYYNIGGIFNEILSLQPTIDNGSIIVGNLEKNTPFIWNRYDSFIIKNDSNGNIINQQIIHVDSSAVSTSPIIKMKDGNFALLTYIYNYFNFAYQVNLKIISQHGSILVDNIIGNDNTIYAISSSPDNGIFLASKTNLSQIMIKKLNNEGKMLWNRSFDFSQWGNTITCDKISSTNDGGPIIAGTILINSNFRKMYLLKLDSLGTATAVMHGAKISEFSLSQNFPNPFNPVTIINYSIPNECFVELKIYNLLGKEVATLVNESQNAGKYSIQFNGSEIPSGVYVYSIKAGEFSNNKKLILIK